jgi:prephenate dehydrogenase
VTGQLDQPAVGASTALVVGTGLIGTSVGLALSGAGWTVWLKDPDPENLRLAAVLGAGRPGLPPSDPTVVLVAVPPAVTAQVICELQCTYLTSIFSDMASIKSQVELDVEHLKVDMARFVGGHPLAGRERSGPGPARADLFEGRPWVLTQQARTSAAALAAMLEVVHVCGAKPFLVSAELHDRAVALVSHVPQLLASLTAARLADADPELLDLAGQGLRDMTRIADSDPGLWTDIIGSNAGPILAVLDSFASDLDHVRAELRGVPVAQEIGLSKDSGIHQSSSRPVDISTDLPFLRALFGRGNAGHRRLPGKHGAARLEFSVVPVVVSDRPGELARLLVASGDAGVNVEDVSIEHSPGQAVGLVELSVRPEVAGTLAEALRTRGWSVHA